MLRVVKLAALFWCVGMWHGALLAQTVKPTSQRHAKVVRQASVKRKLPTFRGRPLIYAGQKPVNNKAISLPQPEYPNNPQTARIKKEAVIKVEVFITGLGEVLAAKAISGPRSLRVAAEQAALRAKFSEIHHMPQLVVKAYIVYRFPPAPANTNEKSFPTPAEFSNSIPAHWCIIDSKAVINTRATHLPDADYPLAAREARAEGLVQVEVIVDDAGKVVAAQAISGDRLLHQTTVNATRQAKFPPMLIDGGCHVFAKGLIVYRFTLPQ